MVKPHLRFDGFNGVWVETKLGDVLQYEQPTKYLVESSKYLDDTTLTPVLTGNKAFILGYTSDVDGVYDKGDVIVFDDFTMDFKFANFPFKVKSSAIKLLTVINDKYSIDFYRNLLKSLKLKPNVHRRHWIGLVQHMNPLTPKTLEEQEKIGEFFSLLDERIEHQDVQIANLENYKKALMQKIFSQELRFKDENGQDYPDWETKKLGDMSVLRNGYSFKSKNYDDLGEYNVITITNVKGSRYIENNGSNCVSVIPNNIVEHQILKDEDILISLTGNVGRVSLNHGVNNLLNQRVGLLDITGDVYKELIFQLLSDDRFKQTMEDLGQGAAQKNISKSAIENYQIDIPIEIEEQQKIGQLFKTLDDKILEEKNVLEGLKIMKKGLLQQMLV